MCVYFTCQRDYDDEVEFLHSSPHMKPRSTPLFTMESDEAVQIGGNDGLVDILDNAGEVEMMDTKATSENELTRTIKSPIYSKFRFHPSVTSTADRKLGLIRDRKENSKLYLSAYNEIFINM